MVTAVESVVAGSCTSKPTTATVPSPASAAGIATSSQPSSCSRSAPSGPIVVTCGSQSSIVLARTTSWFFSSDVVSRRKKPGSAKSRSGRPVETTSRTTSPCWRAVTSVESYDDSRTTVGAVGSATSTTSTRVPGAIRPVAAEGSRPITTTRSPTSNSSGVNIPSRGSDPSRTGSAPVTSYTTSVLSSTTRTSREPSVLTTSGSSTPDSCTLVPVSLDLASSACGASGDPAVSAIV